MTHAEWLAEAQRRFGPNVHNWKFVCPACGHVQSVADYKKAGAPREAVAFSCIGRFVGIKRDALGLAHMFGQRSDLPPAEGPGPCNYTCGGLIQLGPVVVTFEDGAERHAFAFAEPITREGE